MAQQQNALATVDDNKAIAILGNSLYPGASSDSIAMVIGYCKANGLDPFQKPVHIVPLYDSKTKSMRDVIMPGINLYRTQAAASGLLAGISKPEFGPIIQFNLGGNLVNAPEYAEVTVQRILPNGMIASFTAIEFFDEAVSVTRDGKPTAIWMKRPKSMLAKTAESQALRKAFPEKAGAPTAEEMEGKVIHAEDDMTGVNVMTEAEAALIDQAMEKANEGEAKFREYFRGLKLADRDTIKKYHPDYMRSIWEAANARIEAEKAKTETVEDIEPIVPVKPDYPSSDIKQNPDGTYSWGN